MAEAKIKPMTINFGPQHPATHTTLRLVLELDGERIVKATPHIGYLHSGFEKLGEHLDFNQYVTIVSRMDYLSPIANDIAWHHAVEKLFGIDVTPRCKVIRTVMSEMARIQNHLLCVGAAALDLAAAAPSGPTFLDYPLDVVFTEAELELPAPSAAPAAEPAAGVEEAAALLAGAERPVVMAGSGLYWGHGEEELRGLVESLGIPVFLNGLGRGCLALHVRHAHEDDASSPRAPCSARLRMAPLCFERASSLKTIHRGSERRQVSAQPIDARAKHDWRRKSWNGATTGAPQT